MSTPHFLPAFVFCIVLLATGPVVSEEIFLKCEIEKMQFETDGQFVDSDGKFHSFTVILDNGNVAQLIPELECKKDERFFRANSTKIFYMCKNDRFSVSYSINRIDGQYFYMHKFPTGREVSYFGICRKGDREF